MSGNITFAPYTTSFPTNPFLSQTQGYTSGYVVDDPTTKNWLASGQLASSELIVMWGGVPISQEINNLGTGSESLGPTIKRATSQSNTNGFSVLNQAGHMVITPGGNSAPSIGTGGSVHFYRIGSGMVRLIVNCDPALISALSTGEFVNGASLYWDVTNYRVTLSTSGSNFALPTGVTLESTQTNSKITAYSASAVTWTTGDAAMIRF
jgi:hypothetical protein